MIKLIIFDVGGVLRDSSKAMNEVFKRSFKDEGFKYDFDKEDTWKLRGIGKYNNSRLCLTALYVIGKEGMNLKEIINKSNPENEIDQIIGDYSVSDDENEVIDRIRSGYKKYYYSEKIKDLIHLTPKAKESIELLSEKGFILSIFTNSSTGSVKRDLAELDLNQFRIILGAEDSPATSEHGKIVCEKKPSGEGIRMILEELSIRSEEAVYVGDTTVDIQAARDAGVKSAVVLCGMGTEKDLREYSPDYVFRELWDLASFFI